MNPGTVLNGDLFGLKKFEIRKTSKGDDMAMAVLTAAEGEYEGKVWKESIANCAGVKEQEVVKVWGTVQTHFRDSNRVEVNISRLESLGASGYTDYLPSQKYAVIDIETVNADFDSLDAKWQDYVLNNLNKSVENKEERKTTSYYPILGSIVCVALYDPNARKGFCYHIDKNKNGDYNKDSDTYVVCATEKDILKKFWEKVTDYDFIVTYNGNSFDNPFIIWRSGINRVKVTKDIIGTRYSGSKHVDLQDELRFYGMHHRGYKLDFVTQVFGITSPKEEGLDGSRVSEYFEQGRYEEIADYCLRDVKATNSLYKVWDEYMRV